MRLQPGQQLPEGFSQQIFGSVYDQPLCSLYAPSGTEGFTGRCDTLPAHCSRNASWCDGGSNPDADAVEELMAVQLTKVSVVELRRTITVRTVGLCGEYGSVSSARHRLTTP